ncbi:MAG: hypothetical protein IKZ82_00365 [Clostridia bacterium]|nr:hypothetical protein [Clostridia bacterium]
MEKSIGRHVLEIRLERQIYVYNPPITVAIDGEKCASVGNGEAIRVLLDDGAHIIELSASFRSRRVEFFMDKDTALIVKWGRISGRILAAFDDRSLYVIEKRALSDSSERARFA